MSLSITNIAATIPLSTNAGTEPSEIKSKALAQLDSREEKVTNHIQTAFDKVASRLDSIEQSAMDNDYSHLAAFANKAADAVSTAGQNVSEQVGQRFDVAEKLLMERPEGGYSISKEDADAMTSKIEQNTESRLSSLVDRSTAMSERLAALQDMANENGLDGDRIEALSERMETRLEQSMERVELRSEKAVELVQSRINERYDIPVDPDPAPVDDGALEHDEVLA